MFKHVNLVRKICWSFYRSTGIEWKELFSEACSVYFEVINLREPEKGAETTWIYHCIQNRLTNFCKKELRQKNIIGIDYWYDSKIDEGVKEFFAPHTHLTPDTAFVVQMVLKNSLRYALSARRAIKMIKTDLHDRGWDYARITKAIINLKAEFLPSPRTRCKYPYKRRTSIVMTET